MKYKKIWKEAVKRRQAVKKKLGVIALIFCLAGAITFQNLLLAFIPGTLIFRVITLFFGMIMFSILYFKFAYEIATTKKNGSRKKTTAIRFKKKGFEAATS